MQAATKKAQQGIDDRFQLEYRALNIFNHVVTEWEKNPRSAQHFDLKIINEAKEISEKMRSLPIW